MPTVAKHPMTGIINVILGEGEKITEQFNSEKVVVYRRDSTTNWELTLVKPLGSLAPESELRAPDKPACNYDPAADPGNPIHQHADGSWWFFDELFSLENGPFNTWDEVFQACTEYCVGLETAQRTAQEMAEEMGKDLTADSIVKKLTEKIFPNTKKVGEVHDETIVETGDDGSND